MIVIEVFTRPGCSYCPQATQFINNFVKGKEIKVKHLNTLTQEGQLLASKLGVMAVPTIFVHSDIHQQRIGFRGKPSENDLNKALEIVSKPEEKPKEKISFLKRIFKR